MASAQRSSTNPSLTKQAMGIVDGPPLEIAGDTPQALRNAVQMLLDIEAIRRIKHAYFRCIDTGNFSELEGLFHPDVDVHFIGGTYEWKLHGRTEYLAALQKSFHSRSVGHHNGHHPEIQILSADEATGIWYLADNMWVMNANNFATGTAIYWDRYRKVDGRWLIAQTRYERIYEMNQRLTAEPKFHANYLAKHGQKLHE
jgi:hypothetical protein